MVRAIWNGAVIAESDDTIVIEGNHYFPADAVKAEFLQASDHHTTCGWKGRASYHSLVVNGRTNRDAAWYYPSPKPAAREIRGHIAFWRGVTIDTSGAGAASRTDAARSTFWDRVRAWTRPAPTARTNGSSPVADLSASSFDAALRTGPTIVDFWAPWCAPCRAFHRRFDDAAAAHPGAVQFARLDVEANPEVAARLDIMSIPTLIAFDRHGNQIDRHVGIPDSGRLAQLIAAADRSTASA